MGHYDEAYEFDAIKEWKEKSGTHKIGDLPKIKECRNPEHEPAKMRLYEPGIYEHICPGCGSKQNFIINNKPTL